MTRDIVIPPKQCRFPREEDQIPRIFPGSGSLVAAMTLSVVFALGCLDAHEGSRSRSASPSFTIVPSPTGLQVPAGGSGYAVVSVTRVNGFSGDITLSLAGLPAGVSGSGTILDGSPSGYLTIAVSGDVSPGSLGGLTLDGWAGALHRTAAFSLIVAPPLPASSLSPDLVNASGGRQANGTVENSAFAAEPVPHEVSASSSGAAEARHGFLPEPSPSLP